MSTRRYSMWAVVIACACAANGGVWYVNPDNSGIQDGTSWETAFTTIQAAIDTAKPAAPAEVWVKEATYDEARAHPTGALVMAENVHVYGGFAGDETARHQRDWLRHETVIDGSAARGGEPAEHVVIGERYSVLDGFTIVGSLADTAGAGAGMYIDEGDYPGTIGVGIVVANCFFEGHISGYGAAMYIEGAGVEISNCRFENNTGMSSGAVYGYNMAALVSRCSFRDNESLSGNGGAIMNILSSAVIDGCRFQDNSAAWGGAVYNTLYSQTQTLNCIFQNNHAGTEGEVGGAICNDNLAENNQIVNCVFVGNEATDGGAVCNINDASGSITNCIVWNNTGANDIAGASLPVEYSDVEDRAPVGTNIQADPKFYDVALHDFRLRTDSPCLNTGTATGAPYNDYEGRARLLNGAVDMGAYEMPRVIHVKNVAPKLGTDGMTWATAYTEILHAVASIDPTEGGQIWVAVGAYGEDRYATGGQIGLYDNTELYGGFAGTETALTERNWTSNLTIIDGSTANGGAPAPHVLVLNQNCLVDGVTVTGGHAIPPAAMGGGLQTLAAGARIVNCNFVGNTADAGGGALELKAGSPLVSHCTFSLNSSANGGAVVVWANCSPTFEDCVFADNAAVYTESVSPSGYGGALDVWSTFPVTLKRCRFTGNVASVGGGAVNLNTDAETECTNCVWWANAVSSGAGGMARVTFGGSLGLAHCTSTGNSALVGSEIYMDSTGLLAVSNSILWTDTDLAIYAPGAPSPVVYYSNVKGWSAGGGNISSDPRFFDSAAGNLLLRSDSPCLNTAGTLDLADTDVRGVTRPQSTWYDMGAYEMGVHMLNISAAGNGQVTPPVGSNPVVDGDTVSILATPDPGYYFDHWDGDIVASTPNIELAVNSDMSLTAIFLPCQIVVETPNGGETFVAGQKYQVHWRSEGYTGDAVRIELLRKGNVYLVLKSETPNDGKQSCKLPNWIKPGSKYQIRVISTTQPQYNDRSDGKFSVVAAT